MADHDAVSERLTVSERLRRCAGRIVRRRNGWYPERLRDRSAHPAGIAHLTL
jgi:hypothetical protein